jgi:urease beta subunit
MNEGIAGVRLASGTIGLREGRQRLHLRVENSSQRIVRVSSHYPFWRTNPRLRFDRALAHGYHLDIPAGDTLRWLPGETKTITLVRYAAAGDDEADGT